MSMTYDTGIQHPNQPDWAIAHAGEIDPQHREEIVARYQGVSPDMVNLEELLGKLSLAKAKNHSYRGMHEMTSLALLGVPNKLDTGHHSYALRCEYDGLAGQADKVGHLISWFSKVTHNAFVAQESMSPEYRTLQFASTELGGTEQDGIWDSTGTLDAMANNIPAKVLEVVPNAEIRVYGQAQEHHIDGVEYVGHANKSYTLYPLYKPTHILHSGFLQFDYAMLRRRRPFADIKIPNESELIIFKESISLLVLGVMDEEQRQEIVRDCQREYNDARQRKSLSDEEQDEKGIKFQDTRAAKLAGALFEAAIASGPGATLDLLPSSAHFVQAVGDKFDHRKRFQA